MGSVRFAVKVCWGGLRPGPGSYFDHNTYTFYILYYYILLYYIYFLYINLYKNLPDGSDGSLIPPDPKILLNVFNRFGH